MPAKAGIQKGLKILDSRLCGNDDKRSNDARWDFEIGSNQFILYKKSFLSKDGSINFQIWDNISEARGDNDDQDS